MGWRRRRRGTHLPVDFVLGRVGHRNRASERGVFELDEFAVLFSRKDAEDACSEARNLAWHVLGSERVRAEWGLVGEC